MASPLLSSFCCEFRCDLESNASCMLKVPTWHQFLSNATLSYNILCIVSSIIGIFGAIYQLKLRLMDWRGQSSPLPKVIEHQSKIIFWLAASDGFASLGVLIRSCAWINFKQPFLWHSSPSRDLFCAISSGWIQYYYICTYIWTILFAIDTYMNAADKNKCSLWFYHLVSWGFSLIISVGGLVSLYYPGLNSCGNGQCWRRLPHYLASYVPILCVMVINPILFFRTSMLVRRDLRNRGSSLYEQKQIVWEVLSKFFSVVIIFYACWLPNVVNGIWLLVVTSHADLEIQDVQSFAYGFGIALWQMMALLNPLQGFLNTLVYSSIALWPNAQLIRVRHQFPASPADAGNSSVRAENDDHSSESSSDDENHWAQERSETSPLLLFR